MTASIAHEINQPLAAIVVNAKAGLRWLDRAEPNIAEVRGVLDRIVSEGHRTEEVIASIRAMFGKEHREAGPVKVNALIEEVLALMHGELESHQISLRTEMRDAVPDVMAERVQLQQVLINLITNAVDAMSSQTDQQRRLIIKSELADARDVRISVEDSGSGIDPAHIDGIFDPFFTTKSHGMGLGLSICRSIVESYGGQLSASSSHPGGSVFQVVLPAGGSERQ